MLMGILAILTPRKRLCSQNGRGEGQKAHVFSGTLSGCDETLNYFPDHSLMFVANNNNSISKLVEQLYW